VNEETLHEQLKNIDSKVTLVWDKLEKVEMDVMSVKLRLAAMPCEVHKEKMAGFTDHINNSKAWRTGILGTAIVVISLAVSWGNLWGAMQKTVETHEKALEHCCGDKNYKMSALQ
jgi:hypothetical protein